MPETNSRELENQQRTHPVGFGDPKLAAETEWLDKNDYTQTDPTSWLQPGEILAIRRRKTPSFPVPVEERIEFSYDHVLYLGCTDNQPVVLILEVYRSVEDGNPLIYRIEYITHMTPLEDLLTTEGSSFLLLDLYVADKLTKERIPPALITSKLHQTAKEEGCYVLSGSTTAFRRTWEAWTEMTYFTELVKKAGYVLVARSPDGGFSTQAEVGDRFLGVLGSGIFGFVGLVVAFGLRAAFRR